MKHGGFCGTDSPVTRIVLCFVWFALITWGGVGSGIARAQPVPIPLVNTGFEQPALSQGEYYWYLNNPNAPGWTSRNPSDGGICYPTEYASGAPQGHNVARVNNWGLRFNQSVSANVEAGKTYTAHIWVGSPSQNYARAGCFELWAGAVFGSTPDDITGGTRLAYKIARTASWGPGTGEALMPDLGFVELTLTYTAKTGDPGIGKPLTLSFYTIGGSAGPTDWDNVSLTFQTDTAVPDLGVRFISRAPLYWRYNVQYDGNGRPSLAPTHNNQDPALDKHWPASGENVTFTAHIRNHGNASVSNFTYKWYIDNVLRATQNYSGTVAPGSEVTVTHTWVWPGNLNDHTIKLVIDPDNALPDAYRQNNTYTDHTNALSFSIWVEQGLFERFNNRKNGFGTYSFDDWFRWQFDTMKENFARSLYPNFAPNGILERIRVEEINVIPFNPNNLNNWVDVMNSDPHMMLNDGRWQFTSYTDTLAQKEADWDGYVDYAVTTIDWGLIHELAHQLGVIDEYRLNLDDPNANQVLTQQGQPLRTRHNFHLGGLMGGGYVLPEYEGNYFDSHTAGYLNKNLHYRRGFYGEYLFDTPQQNVLQVYDIKGAPLAFAQVTAYQKSVQTETITNTPVFSVTTDVNGRATLPNRSVAGVTTATGHTLRANPSGQIHVVGINGTMLLKFTQGLQEDFRWLEINQLNEAFWQGATTTATYRFDTAILPWKRATSGPQLVEMPIGTTNLARNRTATASSNASLARYANDGDRTTFDQSWRPDTSAAGQWWQVDLGRITPLTRAVVYPSAINYHDWYRAFHLEVSATGAFAGEQTVVATETEWDISRSDGDYLLQRLTGLVDRVVYTFPPVLGRYFRVVSDAPQDWVQLQELELYGPETLRSKRATR